MARSTYWRACFVILILMRGDGPLPAFPITFFWVFCAFVPQPAGQQEVRRPAGSNARQM